jgi:signal-induced proliferation-associated 1 like protein 3
VLSTRAVSLPRVGVPGAFSVIVGVGVVVPPDDVPPLDVPPPMGLMLALPPDVTVPPPVPVVPVVPPLVVVPLPVEPVVVVPDPLVPVVVPVLPVVPVVVPDVVPPVVPVVVLPPVLAAAMGDEPPPLLQAPSASKLADNNRPGILADRITSPVATMVNGDTHPFVRAWAERGGP